MKIQTHLKDLKLFLTYVLPTMFSMLIWGSYSVIDAVFIGHQAGELGLTAINLSYPISMIMAAVGALTGTGAGVLVGQLRGAKKNASAAEVMGCMIVGQFILCMILIPTMFVLLPQIFTAMGATDDLLHDATIYGRIVCAGAFGTMWTTGLTTVIRNDGRPNVAMMLDVIGLVLNIILDFIFIFPLQGGVIGAALAIVVSEAVEVIGCILYFALGYTNLPLKKSCFHIRKQYVKKIFKAGLPSFGLSISMITFLSLYNFQALKYGGQTGLAACTVINEIEALVLLLISGLAAGVQPLISFLHGEKSYRRQNRIGRLGYLMSVLTGFIFVATLYHGAAWFPKMFDISGAAAHLATQGMHISAWSFIFTGLIQVAAAYYQATNKITYSSLLIYGDTFCVLPICLFLLPIWFGIDGVWLALPASKSILFVVLICMWGRRIYKRFVTIEPEPDVSALGIN